MQKKIVLIILVFAFIMSISGTVAATGSNITNCITLCNKDIANPPKCNVIAQNNYCNIYSPIINNTCPSSLQLSCTVPKCNYSWSYNCNYKVNTIICTPNLNTINCGDPCPTNNNPPICVITPTPITSICDPITPICNPITSICDPNTTVNIPSPILDPGNTLGGDKNGGAAADKTKVNAATVPLQKTGLPIFFLIAAILIVFASSLPKRK